MKKNAILSIALVAGISLATGITLVACNKNNQVVNESKDMGSVIKTKDDVYAYSMYSTTTLLSNLNTTAIASLANEGTNNDQAVNAEEIKKINDYVEMFNGLLASKGIDQVTEENKDSDYSDYKTKMTIKENGKTYLSYLNETAKNADKESNENEGENDKESETAIETLLNGIMFEIDTEGQQVPNSYYIIEGSKEFEEETKDNETEKETSIKLTSYLAEVNEEGKYTKVPNTKSITVKQEFEVETKSGKEEVEQSFKYIVKDGNGQVINDECSEIEIEKENDEVEISLTLGYNEDTAKVYEFKKVNETLEVEVYEGEDKLIEEIKITTVVNEDGTKKNIYEFKDGKKVEEDD